MKEVSQHKGSSGKFTLNIPTIGMRDGKYFLNTLQNVSYRGRVKVELASYQYVKFIITEQCRSTRRNLRGVGALALPLVF